MEFQIVATKTFTVKIEVAITEAGHRWRFSDANMPFSQQVYGSVDEALEGAKLFAQEHQIPLKPFIA